MAIHANEAANHGLRTDVMGLPETITEHGDAGTAADVIGSSEQASCGWAHTENVEVISRWRKCR